MRTRQMIIGGSGKKQMALVKCRPLRFLKLKTIFEIDEEALKSFQMVSGPIRLDSCCLGYLWLILNKGLVAQIALINLALG